MTPLPDIPSIKTTQEVNNEPMWKKLANPPSTNRNKVGPVTTDADYSSETKQPKLNRRPDPVIRASNSVSNQDFLALAVMEGHLEKVQSVVDAYTSLFGVVSGFEVVMRFLYDVNPR